MLQEEGDSIGSAGSLAQPRSVPEVWGEEGELSGCPDQGCDHFDDHGVDHFDDQGCDHFDDHGGDHFDDQGCDHFDDHGFDHLDDQTA